MTTDTQSLISLIHNLNTASAHQRYNALLEWLLLHPTVFTDSQKEELIRPFKEARDKKVEQTRADANKRWSANAKGSKVKMPDAWLFIAHSHYMGSCQKCQNKYMVDEAIFVKNRKGWHEACAPEEAKAAPECASFYQAWLKENTK